MSNRMASGVHENEPEFLPDESASLVISTAGELAAAREDAGLNQQDIVDRLKLNPQQLLDLERGDFEALPGRAFVRAMVRAYSRLLNADASPLLESIGGFAQPSDLTSAMSRRPASALHRRALGQSAMINRAGKNRFPWLWPALGMGVLAAVVLQFLLPPESARGGHDGSTSIVTIPATSGSAGRIAAGKSPSFISASSGPELTSIPQGAAASHATRLLTERIQIAPGSATKLPAGEVAINGGAGKAVVGLSAVSVDKTAATDASKPLKFPVKMPATEAISLTFKKAAWVEIRHKDGEKLLFGTQKANKSLTIRGVVPMKVVIGNPDGVRMVFRGKEINLREKTRRGISRFTLN